MHIHTNKNDLEPLLVFLLSNISTYYPLLKLKLRTKVKNYKLTKINLSDFCHSSVYPLLLNDLLYSPLFLLYLVSWYLLFIIIIN